jgi:hypothetical protein
VHHYLFSGNFQPFSIPMPVTTKSDVLVICIDECFFRHEGKFTGLRDQGSEQEPRGKDEETIFPPGILEKLVPPILLQTDFQFILNMPMA